MRRYGAHTSTGRSKKASKNVGQLVLVEAQQHLEPVGVQAAGAPQRRAATRRPTRARGSGRAATRAGPGDRRRDAWRGPQRGGDGVAGGRVGVAGGGPEAGHRAAAWRQRPADGDRDALGAARRSGCRSGRPAAGRGRSAGPAGGRRAPSPRRASRRRPAPRSRNVGGEPGRRRPGAGPSASAAPRSTRRAAARPRRRRSAVWAADAAAGAGVPWRRRRGGRRRRRPSCSSLLPHAHVADPLDVGRRGVDPGGEVGAQGVVVEDRVRPLEHVAAVAVDDRPPATSRRSSWPGRSGTSSRHVPYVAVHGRPSPTTATASPAARAAAASASPAGPSPTTARSTAVGQCSSAAMRRNCSTTSGLRWFGSSVR